VVQLRFLLPFGVGIAVAFPSPSVAICEPVGSLLLLQLRPSATHKAPNRPTRPQRLSTYGITEGCEALAALAILLPFGAAVLRLWAVPIAIYLFYFFIVVGFVGVL